MCSPPPSLAIASLKTLSMKQLKSRGDRTQPCLTPDSTSKLGTRSHLPSPGTRFLRAVPGRCQSVPGALYISSRLQWGPAGLLTCTLLWGQRRTYRLGYGILWLSLQLAGLPKSDPQYHILFENHTGLSTAGAPWWSAAFPGESTLAPCRAHWAVPLHINCHRSSCPSFYGVAQVLHLSTLVVLVLSSIPLVTALLTASQLLHFLHSSTIQPESCCFSISQPHDCTLHFFPG